MVPGEGHGQNVKGAWSISQKVPALQLYGPHYLWEGPCLFWFVPRSVNGPKSSPQKNLVKMWKVLGPFPIRCLPCNSMDHTIYGRDHVCSGLFPGQLMVPGHPYKRT
jgi:hypothetical protein